MSSKSTRDYRALLAGQKTPWLLQCAAYPIGAARASRSAVIIARCRAMVRAEILKRTGARPPVAGAGSLA